MKKVLLFAVALVLPLLVSAQSTLYQQYIERYKDIAVREMQRYGIPASITLAQGLLESGAGTSTLAVKANNHFGIKTGGTWTGPTFAKDDDARGELFRAYGSALESYEDHSQFLKNRSRYASLFTLPTTDYKGWARGLKAAGYATNPEYANKLISIIEIYNLHQYDAPVAAAKTPSAGHKTETPRTTKPKDNAQRPTANVQRSIVNVQSLNGIPYVVSRQGDTWESIAKQNGKSRRKLLKYNEVPDGRALSEGSIVFLHKKSSHAEKSLRGRQHQVRAGESLYSISQRYAVTLKSLYKKNHLADDYAPAVGDLITLP